MEEAPTITEEFEEVKKVEKRDHPQKASTQGKIEDEEKVKVSRVSFSPLPLDSPIEKSSLSVSNEVLVDKSSSSVNWDSPEMDNMATGLQAGYRGMKVREEQAEKDKEDEKIANCKKKDIEERLDIDLEDPDVVKATTKIQAGFRGAMTRKSMKEKKKNNDPVSSRIVKTPEIVVDKGSESGSEYTYEYTYVEESEGEEESESLTERPDSPLTAIGGKVGMNIWLLTRESSTQYK